MIASRELTEFLDRRGLGAGELEVEPIAGGHSNLTFLLRRGGERMVLRRPPLGELAPSANDVVREARVVAGLAGHLPVPEILAVCEQEDVIGAPFYVASFVGGEALVDELPAGFDPGADPARIARLLIETLAALHEVDLAATGLARIGRPSGYLERQLRRFSALLEANATRPLPELERVRDWLAENRPESPAPTLVHGDYRLGNLLFAADPPRVTAVLDWEMATIGDPLADLGYCTAMWAEPGDPPNPMLELSGVTRLPGFPSRAELSRAYAAISGRPLESLAWYQALALWKAAIFLEGSYGRHLAGDSDDPYFATLGPGVPALARAALALTA